MAITKSDFYAQSLNQFAPKRLRGELLDWGLNAWVLEVQIDASQATPLLAGDLVKVYPESTGKLKVVTGTSADKCVGVILYNPKRESFVAGDICSILIRGGVVSEVTEEEINAGAEVYYKDADGSVTATAGGNRLGFAMAKTEATVGGTLIPVLLA